MGLAGSCPVSTSCSVSWATPIMGHNACPQWASHHPQVGAASVTGIAMQMLEYPNHVEGANLDCASNDEAMLPILLHSQAGTAWGGAQEVLDDLTVDLHHRDVHLLSTAAQGVHPMALGLLQEYLLHAAKDRHNVHE